MVLARLKQAGEEYEIPRALFTIDLKKYLVILC
jgi:hypothetical protein